MIASPDSRSFSQSLQHGIHRERMEFAWTPAALTVKSAGVEVHAAHSALDAKAAVNWADVGNSINHIEN